MTEDPAHTPLTEAEQAYYNQLDEDVTAGRVPAIGRGTRRDGSRVSDTELDAVLRGRPGLGPELHRLGWFVFQSGVFRWDGGGGVVVLGH